MKVTRLGPTHLKNLVNVRTHVVQLEIWGLLRSNSLLRSPMQSYLFRALIGERPKVTCFRVDHRLPVNRGCDLPSGLLEGDFLRPLLTHIIIRLDNWRA